MSERTAFIDAILNNPGDDTARLVFADWLEEHGEPERAEFIRCQIEAAKLPEAERGKSEPHKRGSALAKQFAKQWQAALGLGRRSGQFQCGFLTDAEVSIHEFNLKTKKALSREPAFITLLLHPPRNAVQHSISPDGVEEFARNPLLRVIRTIISDEGRFGAEQFVKLMKSPHLTNLSVIDISEDYIDASGISAVANAPAAFSLNYLGLKSVGLDAEGIQALLTSKTLPQTMLLRIEEWNGIEDRFVDALAKRFELLRDDEDTNEEGDEEYDPEDRWR